VDTTQVVCVCNLVGYQPCVPMCSVQTMMSVVSTVNTLWHSIDSDLTRNLRCCICLLTGCACASDSSSCKAAIGMHDAAHYVATCIEFFLAYRMFAT
jgi:hypothetical protein